MSLMFEVYDSYNYLIGESESLKDAISMAEQRLLKFYEVGIVEPCIVKCFNFDKSDEPRFTFYYEIEVSHGCDSSYYEENREHRLGINELV